MSAKHAQMAGQFVAVVLAFGVGILIGQQFCAPQIPDPEPPDCPPEIQLADNCPPAQPPQQGDSPPPQSEPTPASPDAPEAGSSLPDAAPAPSPQQRQKLLRWARAQSSTLQGCPRDMGRTYRLAISLDLNQDTGDVDELTIDNDGDPDPAFQACIRERIASWTLPSEFDPPRRPLMFRLTL